MRRCIVEGVPLPSHPPNAQPAQSGPSRRPQRIEGTAADGLITVTVSASGELLGVRVYRGQYCREDPPGLANVGDMVVEALRDAKGRALAFTDYTPGGAGSPSV
jgi:hypothetical protein